MNNLTLSAESGKHDAIYRLQALAVKAQRKGDAARAAELKARIETLKAA